MVVPVLEHLQDPDQLEVKDSINLEMVAGPAHKAVVPEQMEVLGAPVVFMAAVVAVAVAVMADLLTVVLVVLVAKAPFTSILGKEKICTDMQS
jgi:hypothetical protein